MPNTIHGGSLAASWPTRIGLVLMTALAVVLATACRPASAETLVKDGNEAFAKQAYDEAWAAYQAAQTKSPELAEPYYNAANALYRQGAYAEALEQLQLALSFTEDQVLAEHSLYNQGNSSFSVEEWEAALAAYTETLLLNPEDHDAKYNLELALQQLQQQQQDQQQQQQQQDQENQDQQEQQGGENEDQSDNQNQSDQEQQGQGQDQQNQDQQQQGDKSQDQQQQGDQSQDGQQQDSGQQTGDQSEPQDGQSQPDQQSPPSQTPAPGQRMTAEQAEQLLAAIARESETLQERLGQVFVVPSAPPAQDW